MPFSFDTCRKSAKKRWTSCRTGDFERAKYLGFCDFVWFLVLGYLIQLESSMIVLEEPDFFITHTNLFDWLEVLVILVKPTCVAHLWAFVLRTEVLVLHSKTTEFGSDWVTSPWKSSKCLWSIFRQQVHCHTQSCTEAKALQWCFVIPLFVIYPKMRECTNRSFVATLICILKAPFSDVINSVNFSPFFIVQATHGLSLNQAKNVRVSDIILSKTAW